MTENNFITGVTPVGRMLSGALFTPSDKGFQNRKLDTPVYFLQLAIPKTDPGLPEIFGNITQAARDGFPEFFDTAGNCVKQDFSWKFKDGDAPENNRKEGWSGCYVFTFRTQFALRAIVDDRFNQILDQNAIKPGYQVRISYSTVANMDPNRSGIYLNMDMVQLIARDKEISVGPPPAEVFGTAAAPLPTAQGYTPQGQPGVPVQGQPGVPVQGQPGVPVQGQPGVPVQGQPGVPVQGQPGVPVQGQPGVPVQGQPGVPVQGQPGVPVQGQPGYAADPSFLQPPNGNVPF